MDDLGEGASAEAEIVERSERAGVSAARFSSVLDTAVDGIIVIDQSGAILAYNAACERMFGYDAAEMLGRNVKLMMPGGFADHHDRYLRNYVETGRRKIIGIGREVMGRHRDGTTFPVELSVGEASTSEGRQFIGIVRDIRQRREAEERMKTLQAELIRMSRVAGTNAVGAALAHEINQPLTALLIHLQSASRLAAKAGAEALPAALGEATEKALREARRAVEIVRRIRTLAQKREPRRLAVDLDATVDEAIELALIGRHAPPPVMRRRGAIGTAVIDPVEVQQVVVNLVTNALDAVAGRPDARIEIATGREPRAFLIRVADNGPGVAPGVLPDLFKAFASGKAEGLGLGLSIAKTIAQNHGGDIEVDPGGAGRGAAFTVRLPAGGASARRPKAAS